MNAMTEELHEGIGTGLDLVAAEIVLEAEAILGAGGGHMERLTVAVEPELVEALRRVGRREGTSVTVLVNLALKEFLGSMEDEFELDGLPSVRVLQTVVPANEFPLTVFPA